MESRAIDNEGTLQCNKARKSTMDRRCLTLLCDPLRVAESFLFLSHDWGWTGQAMGTQDLDSTASTLLAPHSS